MVVIVEIVVMEAMTSEVEMPKDIPYPKPVMKPL